MSGTILVVEDEPDLLLVVTLMLEGAGYSVVGASNGEDALALLPREQPDLVLLDLRLPGIQGLDVLEHIRNAEPERHVPVVVVSAHASESTLQSAEELGCDGYLIKPFQQEQLLEVAARSIRR